MGWLGSIGGVLGIISFTETYVTRLVKAFIPHSDEDYPTRVKKKFKDFEKKHSGQAVNAPEKKGDPPWTVGVQVGLDGTGLKVNRFFFLFILLNSRNEVQVANKSETQITLPVTPKHELRFG